MTAPLLIEYLRRDGEPLLLSDLGINYLTALRLPLAQASRPFRVEAEPKTSTKGYVHFNYQQGGVPLPDGLNTRLRVGGVEVLMEDERISQAGNRGRAGTSVINFAGVPYDVRVYISRSSNHCWVSVSALRSAGRAVPAAPPPIGGGRIV